MPETERHVDTPLAAAQCAFDNAKRESVVSGESLSPLEAAVQAALRHPDARHPAASHVALVEAIEGEIERLYKEAGDPQLNEFAQQQAQAGADSLTAILNQCRAK